MHSISAQPLLESLSAHRKGNLVVVTGAGISHASGIPTFRGTDRDAVWNRDVTELGTNRFFRRDPVASWQWYKDRFDGVTDKEPNAAHLAVVDIERWQKKSGGRFLLITQNVDTLHEDAGIQSLIKVHGSVDRVRCTSTGCKNGPPRGSVLRASVNFQPFVRDPCVETLPRCAMCGAVLRQHVLWFDEFYDSHADYRWADVLDSAQGMDLVVFVGTSFAVGVTDLFVQTALKRSIPAFSIDPGAHRGPSSAIVQITARSEVLLPQVAAAIGACTAC